MVDDEGAPRGAFALRDVVHVRGVRGLLPVRGRRGVHDPRAVCEVARNQNP